MKTKALDFIAKYYLMAVAAVLLGGFLWMVYDMAKIAPGSLLIWPTIAMVIWSLKRMDERDSRDKKVKQRLERTKKFLQSRKR